MYDTNKTKPVTTPGSKNYSSSPLAKIWKVQKEFQADPEKPTYLLRGKTDKMLLGINAGIAAVSFLVNMYFMNELRKKYTQ